MEEISLLNFTAFDYYDYYKDKMIDGAKQVFGRSAVRPEDVEKYPTDTHVIVGGMVSEDVQFKRNKKGQEWAIVKLSNNGTTISIQVFAKQLEADDKSDSKLIRNLKKYMPVIFRGKVNRWEGRLSVVFEPDTHNNMPGGILLL
jgi:DNA polymerase III alpha subunit